MPGRYNASGVHEVGIMREALEIAVDAARNAGADRITRIALEIGALAGVAPEALEFAFDAITAGTMAEGATFEWREIEVTCRCDTGCPDFRPDGVVFRCPICGVVSTDVLSGRELRVVEIDVDE